MIFDPFTPRPDQAKIERHLSQLGLHDAQVYFRKADEDPLAKAIDVLEKRLPRDPSDAMSAVIQNEMAAASKNLKTELLRLNDLDALAARKYAGIPRECFKIEGSASPFPDQSHILFKARQLKSALVFSVIRDSRTLSPQGRTQLLDARTGAELNVIYNGLYRPQIQVPVSFTMPGEAITML